MLHVSSLNTSGTGNTVVKAIAVLKEHNVLEENIILSNLFCTPIAAKSLVTAFPKVQRSLCFCACIS
jgi:uracil phosphoribosyltransferase